MTTVSDIVPQAVLTKIADRIAKSARAFAKGKGKGGRVARAIKIGIPKVTQNQIQINIELDAGIAPEAPAFEWGSGIHATKRVKGYVIIAPKNYPTLQFEGTNKFAGQIIRTKVVAHPGIRPQPFIEKAKMNTRQRNLDDLRKASINNMRLIVKSMAKKV